MKSYLVNTHSKFLLNYFKIYFLNITYHVQSEANGSKLDFYDCKQMKSNFKLLSKSLQKENFKKKSFFLTFKQTHPCKKIKIKTNTPIIYFILFGMTNIYVVFL
jgi:hypothetical protein